jgi:hypothetical protein
MATTGDSVNFPGRYDRSTFNIKPTIYQQVQPPPLDPARVAEAERLLARIPLDRVPARAPVPAGSRIQIRPNPLFVGREDDLKDLARAVAGGEAVAITQVAAVTGMGGIGKTQLAAEFVHRYGQYFAGGVYWLSFANPTAVAAEIVDCGGAGGLELRHDFATLLAPEQVKLVLAAWLSPLPRLLVFDNCEDEAPMAEWRPTSGGCRVLLTSRRTRWSAGLGVHSHAVDVLPRAQSIELLRKHCAEITAEEADPIAAELGDLPLALHLAGCFLARYRAAVTPGAYLAQLRRPDLLAHRSLTTGDLSPTDHEQHVARTFSLSYDKLKPEEPADVMALELLARAACFAPNPSRAISWSSVSLRRWKIRCAPKMPSSASTSMVSSTDNSMAWYCIVCLPVSFRTRRRAVSR